MGILGRDLQAEHVLERGQVDGVHRVDGAAFIEEVHGDEVGIALLVDARQTMGQQQAVEGRGQEGTVHLRGRKVLLQGAQAGAHVLDLVADGREVDVRHEATQVFDHETPAQADEGVVEEVEQHEMPRSRLAPALHDGFLPFLHHLEGMGGGVHVLQHVIPGEVGQGLVVIRACGRSDEVAIGRLSPAPFGEWGKDGVVEEDEPSAIGSHPLEGGPMTFCVGVPVSRTKEKGTHAGSRDGVAEDGGVVGAALEEDRDDLFRVFPQPASDDGEPLGEGLHPCSFEPGSGPDPLLDCGGLVGEDGSAVKLPDVEHEGAGAESELVGEAESLLCVRREAGQVGRVRVVAAEEAGLVEAHLPVGAKYSNPSRHVHPAGAWSWKDFRNRPEGGDLHVPS